MDVSLPRRIQVGPHPIGDGAPLVLLAGPCVIESRDHALALAEHIAALARRLELPLVFKSSYDKANRTSHTSFRGPGIDEGLRVLEQVRREVGVPVTTDVHEPGQAAAAAEVVDLLQVPAFLCRQTDLLVACGRSGRPVNVKKGQFLAPAEVGPLLGKLEAAGAVGAMVTERGTTFGYHDLVVDMRGLAAMRRLGVPTCFDATHASQRPGAAGVRSGGCWRDAPVLARAAAAVGVDAVFMEVHEDPSRAPSDGPNMVPLDELAGVLRQVVGIDRARREMEGS